MKYLLWNIQLHNSYERSWNVGVIENIFSPLIYFSASKRRQKWNSVKSVMSYRKCITYCVFPVSKYVIQNMSAKESTIKDLDSVLRSSL